MFQIKSKIIALIILLITIQNMNCGKNSTEPEDPRINADKTNLTFDSPLNQTIIITNNGKGELSWNVKVKPDWLDLLNDKGTISNDKDTITISLSKEIKSSENTGEIIIESNGGTVNVVVKTLLVVDIAPGLGAAGSKIGETVGQIKATHGSTYTVSYWSWYESGFLKTFFIMKYSSKGISFYITRYPSDSNTLTDNDIIEAISLNSPYKYVTDKFIGIGSKLENVISAYNSPDKINDAGYYDYSSIGMLFFYDEDNSTTVSSIKVSSTP